jgi:hypothetical protein
LVTRGSVKVPPLVFDLPDSAANEEKPAIVAKEALAPIFKKSLLFVIAIDFYL